MKSLRFGILFIVLAIILGALAAHTLKNIFDTDRLNSFKTGVTYLMYSGIGLLVLEALKSKFSKIGFRIGTTLLIIGSILFSGSIFLLCWFNQIGLIQLNKLIGISTPIGGSIMIIAWLFLFVNILRE